MDHESYAFVKIYFEVRYSNAISTVLLCCGMGKEGVIIPRRAIFLEMIPYRVGK